MVLPVSKTMLNLHPFTVKLLRETSDRVKNLLGSQLDGMKVVIKSTLGLTISPFNKLLKRLCLYSFKGSMRWQDTA